MLTLSTSRRGFMQLGATSMAVLSLGAGFASLSGCTKAPAQTGYKILRAGDLEFFSALAPVVLSGSYPSSLSTEAAQARLLHEHRIHHLPVVEGGRLLGILSGHDVLEALVAAEARQLKELATERLLIDTGSY